MYCMGGVETKGLPCEGPGDAHFNLQGGDCFVRKHACENTIWGRYATGSRFASAHIVGEHIAVYEYRAHSMQLLLLILPGSSSSATTIDGKSVVELLVAASTYIRHALYIPSVQLTCAGLLYSSQLSDLTWLWGCM